MLNQRRIEIEEQFVDRFDDGLNPAWVVTEAGSGVVRSAPGALRLMVRPEQRGYSNAQITDYRYPAFNFRWKPPLRLTVTAWCEGDPHGTAGFGFWNHAFSPDARRLPRMPQTIWFFFASPPSNMAFAYGVPGFGWKAETMDAARWDSLWLAPLALPAALLMRNRRLYAKLWPKIQRRLNIGQYALDPALLGERHTYSLDWLVDAASFAVDGVAVHAAPFAPRGPAGLVAWIDNRYAIVTPQGGFGFGIVPVTAEQSLILESIVVERL